MRCVLLLRHATHVISDGIGIVLACENPSRTTVQHKVDESTADRPSIGVIDPNLDPNSNNLPIKTCVPGRRWGVRPRKREIGNSGWHPALTQSDDR